MCTCLLTHLVPKTTHGTLVVASLASSIFTGQVDMVLTSMHVGTSPCGVARGGGMGS